MAYMYVYFILAEIPGVARDSRYIERIGVINYGIIKKNIYFAKVKYNDDFYTYSSFTDTYFHIYCNINYIKMLL
jgi:hypothetical protein